MTNKEKRNDKLFALSGSLIMLLVGLYCHNGWLVAFSMFLIVTGLITEGNPARALGMDSCKDQDESSGRSSGRNSYKSAEDIYRENRYLYGPRPF